MKKLLSLLAIFTIILAGCATGDSESASGEGCDSSDPKITLVTDTGGVNDKSFNQGSWEGVERYCEETGVGATYIESSDISELENNLTIAAEQSEVVVASGFLFSQPIYLAAEANPETDFILIDAEPNDEDGNVVELDNVKSYYFDEAQAGYLVGYLAAASSETGRIGFVGGEKIPPVEKFGYGYILGAQAYNPDIIIDYQYSGSFKDANLGKTIAKTMYSQGADVVFACAGGVNDGVIQAGIEENNNGNTVWVIGVDRDMYDDGIYTDNDGNEQSVILTSAVKNVGEASYEGVVSHFDDTFEGGVTTISYETGGVGIPEENPNLEGMETEIEDAKTSLENYGSLPSSADELEPLVESTVTINGEY